LSPVPCPWEHRNGTALIEAHAEKCPLTGEERRLMLHCGNLRF
jgi:hypothetical protein